MNRIHTLMQHGFSLVTAIFLIVVLAGLGAVMVTFFGAQQQAMAVDALGSRAYQAARAGIEWGAYNISVAPAGVPWAGCGAYPGPDPGPVLFAAGSLQGNLLPFTVRLVCRPYTTYVENGVSIYIFELTSTASNGAAVGSPDRVERSISAVIRQ